MAINKVVFTEPDDTPVDMETTVPLDLLKSLLCRSEDATIEMTAQVADMAALLAEMRDMSKENMKDGLDRSDKLIQLMEEMIKVSGEVRDGLQGSSKSERRTKARRRT